MKAIIGKKIGMTQIFTESGKAVPVTVLDVSNNVYSNKIKVAEDKHKVEISKDKKKNPSKAELGIYKALKFVPRHKVTLDIPNDYEVKLGDEIKADTFSVGDRVDVTAVSKGKGFQGVVKRWGFKGGPKTHGQSDRERAPGSIGSGTTPGRVIKGMKMAGRMGREKKTVQNLTVESIDLESGLMAVSGPIPGNRDSYVLIKQAIKK